MKITNSLIQTVIFSIFFQYSISQTYVISPMEGCEILYQKELIDEDIKFIKNIDSVNINKIKRNAELDAAAKHHAMYLLKYYVDNRTLTHTEKIDYPNFTEKFYIPDRVNNPNVRSAEVCAFFTDAKDLTMTLQEVEQKIREDRKNIDSDWIESDLNSMNAFVDTSKCFFLEVYKNSPNHWKIINSEKYDQCGSYTILASFYTDKWVEENKESAIIFLEERRNNLSGEKLSRQLKMVESLNITHVKVVINVTVFSGN